MSLTPLLRSLDVFIEVGLLLPHGSSFVRMSFLLPPVTHVGTSSSWTQSHLAQLHHLNHWATAAHNNCNTGGTFCGKLTRAHIFAVCSVLLPACFTIRTCTVMFTRCTTSGRLRSAWRQSMLIPSSTSSATCCRQSSDHCWWAHTLPQLWCSSSLLLCPLPFHTVDTTFLSCRHQRHMIFTIRSKFCCISICCYNDMAEDSFQTSKSHRQHSFNCHFPGHLG